MSRSRDNWPAYLAALVACFMLVACAEEDTGPQFATDPRPTRVSDRGSRVAIAVRSCRPRRRSRLPLRSPIFSKCAARCRQSLSPRATMSGRFRATGEAARLFSAPNGSTIRAIDPSPDAQEVAILLETATGEARSSQVVIVDAAGSVVGRASTSRSRLGPHPLPEMPTAADHRLVAARGPGSRAVANWRNRRDCPRCGAARQFRSTLAALPEA